MFERWKYLTPNFSMRMSNLAAAVVRPQFSAALKDRCTRWNQRYARLAAALDGTPHLRLPLTLTEADCQRLGAIVHDTISTLRASP